MQLPRECRWLRPTSDRVREALFSILGQWVGEKEVLDLFSGTGLLGFEALSRGAARCRFVDQRSGAMIERMATSLGLGPERYKIYPQDVAAFLKRDRESADLILSDPPYDLTWLEGLVEDVLTGPRLRAGGVFVLETSRTSPPPMKSLPEGIRVDRRCYGATQLFLFERGKTQDEPGGVILVEPEEG